MQVQSIGHGAQNLAVHRAAPRGVGVEEQDGRMALAICEPGGFAFQQYRRFPPGGARRKLDGAP
jgi:hypothetical protein